MGLFSKFSKKGEELQTVFFYVSMSCPKCEAHVKKVLQENKEVKDYTIDLASKRVEVIFSANQTTMKTIKSSIEDLGYTVELV